MSNAKSVLTKAPGVTVTETDVSNYDVRDRVKPPVTLIFGYSPKGAILDPKYIYTHAQMVSEFGRPEDSLEKYFYNAGVRVLQGGGTPLMVRLPYDNDQANRVKYVRYAVDQPIHLKFIQEYGDKSEEKYREYDNDGVEVLNLMHELDSRLSGYSRISLASETIESMSVNEFDDVMLDSSSLEDDSIYIFDIMKQQLGTNPLLTKNNDTFQYLGIVPVLVPASTAVYIQEKIENNLNNDRLFNLISIPIKYKDDGTVDEVDPNGLVLDGDWTVKKTKPDVQDLLKEIITNFSKVLDFSHRGTFYDKRSLGDEAALTFPLVRYNSTAHLESTYFDQLGVVVFEMVFNKDTDNVDFVLREAFNGYICNTDSEHPPLENTINTKSKYIRIVRKVRRSMYRDFFHISNQPLVVMGMNNLETAKKLNYKKSLEEPLSYILDGWLGDVDGTHIDLILDAGLTTVAHHAWKRYIKEGPEATFFFNPSGENVFYPNPINPLSIDELEYCSTAWNKMIRLFTGFIEKLRGDCLFIADGPRCLNLDRNVPIQQRFPKLNLTDTLNKYLKYFTDKSTSYATRIFNWPMATDWDSQLSIWMPPSIVAARIYAESENHYYPWYAPAGFNRGRASNCNYISVTTKPYTQDNDILYSNSWNFFVQRVDSGVMLEGNKTMQLERTALDRVNVRRLCNYIKRKVRDISNRYKYEENTLATRMLFAEDINSMLELIKRNSGVEEYYVLCDETNNTNETIERNELWCKIAIKPVKAVEYVIVDLRVTKDSVEFTEAVRAPA